MKKTKASEYFRHANENCSNISSLDNIFFLLPVFVRYYTSLLCKPKDIKVTVSNSFFHIDMCIMGGKNAKCPRENDNTIAEKCVVSYITAEACKAAGGTWTKFVANYVEKTGGVLSTCHGFGDMKLARGVPYEPHKLSQGADQQKQFVLLHKPPDVIYAPSTVVNHNGMNMEGKFSSYKWKVPCFPTNTTQRCVLRLR